MEANKIIICDNLKFQDGKYCPKHLEQQDYWVQSGKKQ